MGGPVERRVLLATAHRPAADLHLPTSRQPVERRRLGRQLPDRGLERERLLVAHPRPEHLQPEVGVAEVDQVGTGI